MTIIDAQLSNLKESFKLDKINETVYEISTPFLDCFNDSISIFLHQDNNQFIITDDGYFNSFGLFLVKDDMERLLNQRPNLDFSNGELQISFQSIEHLEYYLLEFIEVVIFFNVKYAMIVNDDYTTPSFPVSKNERLFLKSWSVE